MKKVISIFLLPLLVFTACRKEASPRHIEMSTTPIEFGIPQTKGAQPLASLEQLSLQRFSVSAWYTPDGASFGDESRLYLPNHQFGTLDKSGYTLWQGTAGSRDSETADPVYYPLDGSLTYFCFAPYRAVVDDTSDIQVIYNPESSLTSRMTDYLPYSPLIVFTPSPSPATQIDFVAAPPLLDVKRNSGSLPLDFRNHLLTNIEFYVKCGSAPEPGEEVVITQIVIRKVISSEYFYYTEADGELGYSWCENVSPDGGTDMPTTSYTLSSGTSTPELLTPPAAYLSTAEYKHVNNTINGHIYLLPQILSNEAQLEITYAVKQGATTLDENTIFCPLDGTPAWSVGKTVRYKISVNVAAHQNVDLDVEVIPYESAGNNHSEEELMY